MARQKKILATLESATKFMDRDYMIVNYIDEIGIKRQFRKDNQFHIPDNIMNKPILKISAYYSSVLEHSYLICDVVFA